MKANHIMLDLETLDTGPRSVVTSIGAVVFRPDEDDTLAEFYVELTDDLPSQQECGRTISGDTVKWWMQQDPAAKKIFADPGMPNVRVDLRKGLMMFKGFVAEHESVEGMWGNGADFDNIILGTLYEDCGMRKPWSYGINRCFRTYKNHPGVPHKYERVGTHHNALDDAITQAKHLQRIWSCLK